MSDERCRYYHTISIDDLIVFQGYLLHEEAWIISQKTPFQKSISVSYEKHNTSTKSSECSLLTTLNKSMTNL